MNIKDILNKNTGLKSYKVIGERWREKIYLSAGLITPSDVIELAKNGVKLVGVQYSYSDKNTGEISTGKVVLGTLEELDLLKKFKSTSDLKIIRTQVLDLKEHVGSFKLYTPNYNVVQEDEPLGVPSVGSYTCQCKEFNDIEWDGFIGELNGSKVVNLIGQLIPRQLNCTLL